MPGKSNYRSEHWDGHRLGEARIPRESIMNNLESYLQDLRARAVQGEKVQDRIRATEKRIKTLKRRVG